jgi:hypothetical protein
LVSQLNHLARLAETVEAQGWAERHEAVGPDFREQFGTEVVRYGGVVALFSRHVDIPAFNRVFSLGVHESLTAKRLDEIVHDYRARGVRRMLAHWSPLATPVDGGSWFTQRGFQEIPRMVIMARRVDSPVHVSTDLEIVEMDASAAAEYDLAVGSAHGLSAELTPHARSTLGLPNWRHYLARDRGRAVAGASLFTHGEAAWCAGAATQIEDRNRGAQTALLARRIADAAADGCRWIVAETLEETADRPNPSYRNMLRAGFEVLYLRASFLLNVNSVKA